jgi:hypothetical protein
VQITNVRRASRWNPNHMDEDHLPAHSHLQPWCPTTSLFLKHSDLERNSGESEVLPSRGIYLQTMGELGVGVEPRG